MSELSVEALVRAVLERNPSLAQMGAAWQAAQARYPQVTSLDDPMCGANFAPASIGSREVDFGYRLEVSQKYPWPGKLKLHGENALAEAGAAQNDLEDMRLQLVESAIHAFCDYYLVARALEVNAENLKWLRDAKQNAETRYKTGLDIEQYALQASVEVGREEQRRLTLERMQKVAVARINTLMHLPPDLPLPPPPHQVDIGDAVPDAAALRALALARRPDLQALAYRIAAEQAQLALAGKEFYPDIEVMAAYDAFWQEKDLQPMVGIRVNLPVRRNKRYGAIAEAQAKLAQRQAELARRTDQMNYEVEQAYVQVQESEKTIQLFKTTILRDADLNVKSAQTAYTTGKIPFLSLIEAERSKVQLWDRYYEAVADYCRRRATLERAIGGPLAQMSDGNPYATLRALPDKSCRH